MIPEEPYFETVVVYKDHDVGLIPSLGLHASHSRTVSLGLTQTPVGSYTRFNGQLLCIHGIFIL